MVEASYRRGSRVEAFYVLERVFIMDDQRQRTGKGFSEAVLAESHHMCLIYDNEAQRRGIVSGFLAAGVKHGELVRYFTDTTPPEDVRAWLLESGEELSKVEASGAFGVTAAESAYCPHGRFLPEEVIHNMVSRYAMAREAGYRGSRVSGEMSWVLRGIPGSERFLEYEARINLINDPFPHTGMCQYDARLFDGATLYKVLQVHPYMIAHGQMVMNPFYVKPEEFLAGL